MYLMIEIQSMCNSKINNIPVVRGVREFLTENFGEYLQQIPGIHSPNHLQQVVEFGTAHILRNLLT